jgi:hypothetical protein
MSVMHKIPHAKDPNALDDFSLWDDFMKSQHDVMVWRNIDYLWNFVSVFEGKGQPGGTTLVSMLS